MKHLRLQLAVFLIFIKISQEIILETTKHAEPWYSECKKINFRPENYLTCFCLKGIYAFKITDVDGSEKKSRWRIIGAHEESCHRLGEWVSEIKIISESTEVSLIRQLAAKSNVFITTNIEGWQVKTVDTNYNQKTYCLAGAANKNSYCEYQIMSPLYLAEHHFQKGCEVDSEFISPTECKEFTVTEVTNEIEPIQCSLVEDLQRWKRDVSGPNATTFNEGDEDVTPSPEEEKLVQGNPDMMASISKYVKNQVKELIEQSDPSKTVSMRSGQKKQPPGQTLLRLCSKVAQKICSPVSEDTFSIVVESFLTQQTAFHLKDSYISFPAYDRVLAALTECDGQAGSIIFVPNTTVTCPSKLPTDISEMIKRNGANKTIPSLPVWAPAYPDYYEVVVEVMWKVFLMAHSYCFKFFKQYFNDHHTFTSTIIPFFTNKIQDVWLVKPLTEEMLKVADGNYNYTSASKWYGNLLGNNGDLFRNVDYCYRASRVPVGMKTPWAWNYPWFVRRPVRDGTNEWVHSKAKRSVEDQSKECVVNNL